MSIQTNQITIFMRTITFLNIVLRILFGFATITISILAILVLLAIFNIDVGIGIPQIKNLDIDSPLDILQESISILLAFTYFTSYIYAIYKLRKCLDLFMEYKFFHKNVIRNFNTIGYIFLIGFIVNCILNYSDLLLKASNQESVPLSIEFTDVFLAPLNGLIIGLLFITFSQVFQIAKNQKEENIELKKENELTI